MRQRSVRSRTPKVEQYGAFLSIEGRIFDPRTGREIKKIPPRPANTFVQNWIKCLYNCMQYTPGLTGVIDTGNTARTLTATYDLLRCNAPAAGTTYGIVIGNQVGPTAVTLADYKLQAQVTANVAHGAMTFALNAPDGTHYQLIVSRQFTNNTGSTLNITEVGLYVFDTASGYIFMVDRTLMTINLNNGLATTLAYTWTTHT